ncbi:hypothetical protein E1B28_013779 [Marasmius oreades]|uniref:F-box domain-containing protein n=1 Tax=Marasmius oreades TaxID=181124 RepID=A0A9P7UPC6_9AGAR|nr:uncharacterized protein E1B28_013779 [Marasmius oreades]KAG7087841.1 hypothetical protein E1B28_013779 [Marasmius oreades]
MTYLIRLVLRSAQCSLSLLCTSITLYRMNDHLPSDCTATDTSPVHRVPPEVLSLIFTFAVDSNYFGRRKFPRRVEASSLTKICSRWRSIALETPEIWARISIRDDFFSSVYATRVEQGRLKLCIGRANSFPLSVRLDIEAAVSTDINVIHRPNIEGHTTFLRLLTARSVWGSLVINMTDIQRVDLCRAVIEMIKDNLQFIRRLEVQFANSMEDMDLLHIWQGIDTFPKLQYLDLHHSREKFPSASAKTFMTVDTSIFPYQQLTHISLNLNGRPEETLQVLQLSPNLVFAHIHCYLPQNFSPETTHIPSISLLSLKTLTLDTFQDRSQSKLGVPTLIGALLTPSLNSLSVSWRASDPDEEDLSLISTGLLDLFARSGVSTSLRKLGLFVNGIGTSSPTAWISLLEVLTGLEELQIEISENNRVEVDASAFLQRLAKEHDGRAPRSRFLPNLKHLQIRYINHAIFTYGGRPDRRAWLNGFETMVESRHSRGLRSVLLVIKCVTYEASDLGWNLERLERLQRDGRLAIRVLKAVTPFAKETLVELLGYGLAGSPMDPKP